MANFGKMLPRYSMTLLLLSCPRPSHPHPDPLCCCSTQFPDPDLDSNPDRQFSDISASVAANSNCELDVAIGELSIWILLKKKKCFNISALLLYFKGFK